MFRVFTEDLWCENFRSIIQVVWISELHATCVFEDNWRTENCKGKSKVCNEKNGRATIATRSKFYLPANQGNVNYFIVII